MIHTIKTMVEKKDDYEIYLHESNLYGSFEEFLLESDNSKIVILSPHGGQVEPNTDTEALLIRNNIEDVSVWGTRGIVDGNYNESFEEWHTASETHELENFNLYQSISDQEYKVAISIHVMSKNGIIIGGQSSNHVKKSLKKQFKQSFPEQHVEVVKKGHPLAGMKPNNFVNNLQAEQSIHIEQSLKIAMTKTKKFSRTISKWIKDFDF